MELTKEDAYEVLDLPPGASFDDIVKQYKLLALEWYPDKHNRNNTSLKKFQVISQALLSFCLPDIPFKRNLLTLDEMLSLFQFVFFGNESLDEDDEEEDSSDSFDEEDSFEEFYSSWKYEHADLLNETYKGLNTEVEVTELDDDESIVEKTAKINEAVQNAKELIQEEEREKKKAKKRKAQKKRRKEKKKQEKSAKKGDTLQDERKVEEQEEQEKAKLETTSESEEELDPESAFVAVIAKKNKNISLKKENDMKIKNTAEKLEAKEEDSASRVLRSQQLALRGNEMANLGHYLEAVKLFSEAIRLNPSDHRFYGNRSYCHDRLGNCERALSDAEKSISLAPKVAKGYFRKGKALASLKRYLEAEKCFQEVLNLDQQCEDAVKELFSVRIWQIMDMGFTREQAEDAIHNHSSVEDALESLLPAAAAGLSIRKDEEVFLSDDDEDFLARYMHTKPQSSQTVDVKMDPNNPEGHNSIWVGNLQPGVTEKLVVSLFSKYGEILSVKFTPEKFYAFVNYKNKLSAGKAMRALQGAELYGANLLIRYPNTKPVPGVKPSVGAQDPMKTKTFVVPVNKDECYFWRTLGCIHGDNCRYKHIKEHKGIDKKKLFQKS